MNARRTAICCNCTWFPIALGTLLGMLVWVLLAMLEVPAFHWLSTMIYGEMGPKELFSQPGYYWIHRILLIGLAALGGLIGSAFSIWSWRISFTLLAVLILIVVIVASISFRY